MQRWCLAVALTLLGPAGVSASGLGEVRDAELALLAQRASDFLVRAKLEGGGWVWNLNEGTRGDSYGGIIAESLLAAYEKSGRAVYLEAARDYARVLLEKLERRPSELPYKPDIEFLVRLGEATGETYYAAAAKSWFANVLARSPRGADEVQRIFEGRKAIADIVGYDVALAMRAALAVERYDYARELGAAAWARRDEWLKQPRGTFGTISRAALLDAMLLADARRFAPAIRSLSAALIAEQTANSSWCTNETQATAYATRALAKLDERRAREAAKRGSKWLSSTLLADGKWAHFNDGLPPPFVGDVITAVQAEALSAIIIASRI